MNKLLYYLFVKPLSLLPTRLLYIISDLLYLVMWYAIGYRKKVIIGNIKRSFPAMENAEVTKTAKRFYKHFCDLLVESVKCFSISKKELSKRMKSEDTSLFQNYFDEGKSVIFVAGHYCNWEMYAVAGGKDLPHKLIGIYKQLKNPFWDKKMRVSRMAFGTEMIPTYTVSNVMENLKEPSAIAFLMDQSPSNPRKAYWMDFLGQETAVLMGAEKYARQFNLPVIYGGLIKPKRGHYETTYTLIADNPSTLEKGEILKRTTKVLEGDLLKDPAYWLWSHKRWKHKRPADMAMNEWIDPISSGFEKKEVSA